MNLRRPMLIGSASLFALGLAVDSAAAADANSSTTVGEIVVPGIRQSLEKAIAIKRVSENSVDAVSATDIGKLPDKNVADALQRLPGVNTTSAASGEGGFDENDRVSIRGTSPSLTQVTVDGHSVATGDWFILDQFQTVGRSVSFTLLPAEIVQNVVVYKTQDASQLEGGVSGSVDIQTRDPLSLGKSITFEGSAEGAYNSNSNEFKPQFNGLLGWKNADGTFGVIVQGFYEQRSVERFGQETLGWEPVTAAMPIGQAHPEFINANSNLSVQVPTLIGSTWFKQERTREGATGSVEWKSEDDKAELKFSGFYSHLNADNFNDNYMFWGSGQGEWLNNMPSSFTLKDNTIVAATFPLNNPATGTPVHGLVVDNIIRPNESANSYYFNLDGKLRVSDRLTVKGQVGFTRGKGYTPQSPSFESDGLTGISYAPSGNGFAVTPTNINPQSPNGLANDWAWNETFTELDQEVYGKFDATYDVDSGPFKSVDFGAHVSNHKRQVDGWDRGCSLGGTAAAPVCWTTAMPFADTNPSPYPSGFNAGALGIPGLLLPIAGNPGTIIGILNAINDGVHGPISSIKTPQNYYWPGSFKVEETDVSGYIMAHVGGDNWRGNFGVRIVDTQQSSFVNSHTAFGSESTPVTTSAYGNYYINKVDHNYLDFLPSANFTFDIQKNLLLRVSAAETMARPDFSALGGSVSLTDTTLSGNGGNPDLKPIKAAVYDAALEWYYAPTAVAAVSVFYDDLSSYVSFGINSATYLCMSCTDATHPHGQNETYRISTPFNISGHLEGVEVQVQQPIGWGFGFQANGTYINGEDATGQPLVGTSKWTGNLVGYYEDHGVSLRMAYTYRSHFLVGLDRSSAENQANYGTLDASLAYQITPNIAFTVDALNITNNLLKYYAANPTQVRAIYDNGTQVFFGIKVKF